MLQNIDKSLQMVTIDSCIDDITQTYEMIDKYYTITSLVK